MKNRYDGVPGKEAMTQAMRQRRFESEHNENDAFTKKVQAEQAKFAGKNPVLKKEDMQFNANMMNTGIHAQEFAKELTRDLDKVAFPVK